MAGSWAPCVALDGAGEALRGGVGAPYRPNLLWENKKKLYVVFLNPIPSWRTIPNPPGNFLSTSDILKWANVWSSAKLGLEGVPEFVEWHDGDEGESDIRVKFTSKGGSLSLIGSEAESRRGETTMFLNLTKDDNDFRKYTIIHEFGHALGLMHEHQKPQLADIIDKPKMISFLMDWGMTKHQAEEKFERDYASYSENTLPEMPDFDPKSVMSYPIPEECIKESGRARFTGEQLEMITQGYDKRTALSDIDIKTIKKLYVSDRTGPSAAGPSSSRPSFDNYS